MGIIATICNTKGGVGKTTLTANVGGLLADAGQKVLLIDGDTQPSLSSYYDLILKDHSLGLSELIKLDNPEEFDLTDLSHKTKDIKNLNVIVSNDPSGTLKNWIMERPAGIQKLKDNLRKFNHGYDIILMDSHGGSDFLQLSTVLAADILISPVKPNLMSAREFGRGTLSMIEQLKPVANLGTINVVVNEYNNTNDAKAYAKSLAEETFTGSQRAVRIIKPMISQLVAYSEAVGFGIPAHRYNKRLKKEMVAIVVDIFPHLQDECNQLINGK